MIYFLYGSNSYSLLGRLRQLQHQFVQRYGDNGLERIDGESFPPERLSELLQGMSLFASNRMVVIKNATQQKALWEALGEWVQKVPDEVELVIVESSPDKRTKTFKALNKATSVFVAEELSEGQAVAWLADEAKHQGVELSRKGAQLLVHRIGIGQAQLANELNKLVVHGAIDEALILQLTEASPQATAFELLDAVLEGEVGRAKTIVDDIKGKEDPYRLYGLFASQVHTLALVVAAGSKVSQQQISKEAGVHPYVISKISKKLSWTDTSMIIDITAELDDRLKSSGADPWLLLETALMKIASR